MAQRVARRMSALFMGWDSFLRSVLYLPTCKWWISFWQKWYWHHFLWWADFSWKCTIASRAWTKECGQNLKSIISAAFSRFNGFVWRHGLRLLPQNLTPACHTISCWCKAGFQMGMPFFIPTNHLGLFPHCCSPICCFRYCRLSQSVSLPNAAF